MIAAISHCGALFRRHHGCTRDGSADAQAGRPVCSAHSANRSQAVAMCNKTVRA